MRSTKILIVNPNMTASMTETIAAAARAVAAPGTAFPAGKRYAGMLEPFAPRVQADCGAP
jgi:hypothetical protein